MLHNWWKEREGGVYLIGVNNGRSIWHTKKGALNLDLLHAEKVKKKKYMEGERAGCQSFRDKLGWFI